MKKLLLAFLLMPATVSAAELTDSLFYSDNQLIAIQRALQGYVPPQKAMEMGATSIEAGPPVELRLIRLSGIIFNGTNDWTIWLNGQRVSPKNLPDRVMGLEVASDQIKLKWMDLVRQRVVNLTLHPHQTYDLDSDSILTSTDYR